MKLLRSGLVLPHLIERRWLKRADGRAGARPITVFDNFSDVNLIARQEVKGPTEHLQLISELQNDGVSWKERMRQIEASGALTNLLGGVAGLEGNNTVTGQLAVVTFISGDFAPFNGVTFCPVPNRLTHMDFWSSYVVGLAAAPGTLLVTPGIGIALTAKNLGAGVATATLGTSGTGALILEGVLTTQRLSIPGGATGNFYFTGNMLGKLATTGNGTADVNQIIGFTGVSTVDSTAANGLWMTMTGTATTAFITTQQIRFGSWS
jgi:hypothetical protein